MNLETNLERRIHQYVTGVEASVGDGMVAPASVSNTIADMERFIPRSKDGGERKGAR